MLRMNSFCLFHSLPSFPRYPNLSWYLGHLFSRHSNRQKRRGLGPCQNIIMGAANPKIAGGDRFGGVLHGWPGSRWGDKILSPANCGGGSKFFWIRAPSSEGFLQNRLFDQSASLRLSSHLHPLLINGIDSLVSL